MYHNHLTSILKTVFYWSCFTLSFECHNGMEYILFQLGPLSEQKAKWWKVDTIIFKANKHCEFVVFIWPIYDIHKWRHANFGFLWPPPSSVTFHHKNVIPLKKYVTNCNPSFGPIKLSKGEICVASKFHTPLWVVQVWVLFCAENQTF